MSKIERCPHCGEPIEYNSGEAFCTNCGQTVKYVGGSQASPECYDTEDGPQSGNMSIDERTLYGDNGKTYHREGIYDKFKEVD